MSAMRKSTAAVLAIMAATVVSVSANAQDNTVRKVGEYTCKEVLRENGASRDSAIAFLHGFLMGKAGTDEFDLGKLSAQTDAFIDTCLDNPADKAIDVMSKVKG